MSACSAGDIVLTHFKHVIFNFHTNPRHGYYCVHFIALETGSEKIHSLPKAASK